jgi:hypothetical protein
MMKQARMKDRRRTASNESRLDGTVNTVERLSVFSNPWDVNMWWTSEGERVLLGAEWELFREGLAGIRDHIGDSARGEESFDYGIAAFDNLQPGQQLALLAQVGQALRDEAVPMPELTAHTEGTVAAVFEYIRQAIGTEISLQQDLRGSSHATFWRQLVLAACRQVEEGCEESLPEPSCDDLDEWGFLIDVLADWILWDSDFDMEDCFLDGNPAEGQQKMKELGIARDYYIQVAPDPSEEELNGIRETLREITRRR